VSGFTPSGHLLSALTREKGPRERSDSGEIHKREREREGEGEGEIDLEESIKFLGSIGHRSTVLGQARSAFALRAPPFLLSGCVDRL
jgi:hypothetical protein